MSTERALFVETVSFADLFIVQYNYPACRLSLCLRNKSCANIC